MSKFKNVMKGSLLAVFLAVFSFAPAFANCSWDSSSLEKYNLSTSGGSGTDHPVNCPVKTDDGDTVYGKTSADCAKWGSLATDPDCGKGDLNNTVTNIINTIIFVIGIIAVAMVIMGGVQYSTSQGDAGKVKKAKDTILYGIIGLVVAILAFAIVNFALNGVLG